MEQYCESCGASLKDADYTQPWEDDDNAEGFWTCRYCGHKNIDWSTADDD